MAELLREGYPTLVSNRVDPFAHSNKHQAVPILCMMAQLGLPVAIQTRGGEGIDDVLAVLPPSVWTVSVTFDDDADRKRVEPGAPTIASRYDLMTRLRRHGHRVAAALNPLVPGWIKDARAAVRRVVDAGAEGLWAEGLHFNRDQVVALSRRDRTAIGEDRIATARQRQHGTAAAHYDLMEAAHEAAKECGIPSFSLGRPGPSRFMDIFHDTYPRTFRTLQDVVNSVHDGYVASGGVATHVTRAAFTDYLAGSMPTGRHRLMHYLGSRERRVTREKPLANRATYKELLSVLFDEPRIANCPVRLANFAYAATPADDGRWLQLRVKDGTAKGSPIVIYNPEGHAEMYAAVNVTDYESE